MTPTPARFIELTRLDGSCIWIALDHIVSMWVEGEFTSLVLSTGFGTVMVKQPPEYIMHFRSLKGGGQ